MEIQNFNQGCVQLKLCSGFWLSAAFIILFFHFLCPNLTAILSSPMKAGASQLRLTNSWGIATRYSNLVEHSWFFWIRLNMCIIHNKLVIISHVYSFRTQPIYGRNLSSRKSRWNWSLSANSWHKNPLIWRIRSHLLWRVWTALRSPSPA